MNGIEKPIEAYKDGRMNTCNTSKYTGLSDKTLAMMRCNGTGPKFIKRGRVFYFQSDVDAWMNASGRMTSTAQAKHAGRQKSTVNEWREAVLDQLAVHCLDCPVDTPPREILRMIIEAAVTIRATIQLQ